MLRLNRESLKDKELWRKQEIKVFHFDDEKMRRITRESPEWIHFGPGNIFRAFVAPLQQALLESGSSASGIIAVAPYDGEVIEKIYRPHDCLSLLVTMRAGGQLEKKVIGSIAESLVCNTDFSADWKRLWAVFENPSLRIASFTITEKGYKLRGYAGDYERDVADDIGQGPAAPKSFMGRIAALLYRRFLAGRHPIALLSLDNCSRNGEKLRASIEEISMAWAHGGHVEQAFLEYIQDARRVAFPCSMIDKITPRPSENVRRHLRECGYADADLVQTARGSYYASFVNAEEAEYLVVEDAFPNGRPPLERVGVIFTDKQTVDKVERMKVCTCLNPLHTALAVFGCLLGYTLIADEMQDPLLRRLVEKIGYAEGLPVVTNPSVLDPEKFIREVLEVRFPNANIPDTPQRIASDTSQKVGVRFGETIKAYQVNPVLDSGSLTYIPLAIAGWCRYLLGIDDNGESFAVSPDPLMNDLQDRLKPVRLGDANSLGETLRPILSDQAIFGVNLYEAGLGEKIEGYVREMIAGPRAVKHTLEKYVESH